VIAMLKIKVTSIPIRYQGKRYLPGDTLNISREHLNEKYMKVIGKTGISEDMTVAELKEYAKVKGIELGDATRKDDILNVLGGE